MKQSELVAISEPEVESDSTQTGARPIAFRTPTPIFEFFFPSHFTAAQFQRTLKSTIKLRPAIPLLRDASPLARSCKA